MKILLIVPPNFYNIGENYYITFPLGIAYIAAILEKEHEVKILDSLIEHPFPENITNKFFRVGLDFDEIKKRIAEFSPDVVGITASYSVQQNSVDQTAEAAKSVADIPVIAGGAAVSASPALALNNPHIDYVILGEGEETTRELISRIEKKQDTSDLDGFGFKKEGKVHINNKTNFIKDIDSLPFPARHLLPMEKYFEFGKEHSLYSKRKPHTTMITSRGCPGKCVYCSICSVWGREWRGRNPINVVDEIEHLVKKYGIKEIHFEDDNLALNKKRMENICNEIIKRNLDITWTTPNGVFIQNLDEGILSKMKASGCYRLFLGVESGNQHVLFNVIRKKLKIERVIEVVKILKKLKIEITGFFVLGLPGETIAHINDTINFANKYDFDEILLSIATPYPGTELYEICKEKGYLADTDITILKPKFASISTEDFTKEDILKLRNKGLIRFQLNKMIRHPIRYFTKLQNYKTLLRYSRLFMQYIAKKVFKTK